MFAKFYYIYNRSECVCGTYIKLFQHAFNDCPLNKYHLTFHYTHETMIYT